MGRDVNDVPGEINDDRNTVTEFYILPNNTTAKDLNAICEKGVIDGVEFARRLSAAARGVVFSHPAANPRPLDGQRQPASHEYAY